MASHVSELEILVSIINLEISEGWVLGGWGHPLFGGAQWQDEGQQVQPGTQEVPSAH